jgi:hypothetical protein
VVTCAVCTTVVLVGSSWVPPVLAPREFLPGGEPKLHLVFDIDGTFCHVGARADYDNPRTFAAHCRPMPEPIKRIRDLAREGHWIGFLTGRKEALIAVTFGQLSEWFGPDVAGAAEMWHRDFDPFDWVDYVDFKADVLAETGADLYVGDRDEDRTAAAIAGVPFMHAEHFRQGHSFLQFLPVATRREAGDVTRAIDGTAQAMVEAGVLPLLDSPGEVAAGGKA